MESKTNEDSLDTKDYLILFYHFDRHGYVDFRLEEFASLCSMHGHDNPFPNGFDKKQNLHDPFLMVQLPRDRGEQIAQHIAKRSMLTKAIYDVLVQGDSIQAIVDKLEHMDIASKLEPFIQRSYRLRNVYFGKKCSHDENIENIKMLELPFLSHLKGDVDLHSAEIEYHLVADFGDWTHLGMSKPRETPQRVYLCRFIAGSDRDLIRKFSLKKRKYVGSTSLDSELSFLMANQAKINHGSIVLDPFCGTGSLLIASSYFGGLSYGADIDLRVLRGNKYFQHGIKKTDSRYQHKPVLVEEEEIMKNTEDHSIYANFKQYGLSRPELIRCDLNNLCWLNVNFLMLKFDAIMCDPPYGLRAGARKSGVANPIKVPEQYQDNHHPRTQLYDTTDVIFDLFQFVANYLKINGRFVFLLPATIDFDSDKDLPTHPCLRLVANSEQQCQGIFRRRLITMEKYREFENGMRPFIPPKPDFADMKNKIFFKQHSHHHQNQNKNKHKQKKKKRNKDRQNEKGNVNQNENGNTKRKDSPTLTEVVNPKHTKRQKLCLDDVSGGEQEEDEEEEEDEDVDLGDNTNTDKATATSSH